MRIGTIGLTDYDEKDFSFVQDEIKNLKDIPRDFNEDLYRKLGVSETVIAYWKEIDYRPPYYYIFWLLQDNRNLLLFDEYREVRDSIVNKIFEENEKIGSAVQKLCEVEDKSYSWFIQSDKKYMYKASYHYSDDSGDDIIMTYDYDEVMKSVQHEIKELENDEVTYVVEKYPVLYSENGEITGIDLSDLRGRVSYDEKGCVFEICNMPEFDYYPNCWFELTKPYLFMPHPFSKGDIVYYSLGDEKVYGVLSVAFDKEDERRCAERGLLCDGTDFISLIELIDKEKGKFIVSHAHICPIYLEHYDEEQTWMHTEVHSTLCIARDILKGTSGSLSALWYSMNS